MSGSKRLKPIKKIADNGEKIAAQALGDSVTQQKFQLEKLSQLINYRAEYVEMMSIKSQQGMRGDQLNQYYAFLTKLDKAILHQRELVAQSEAAVTQSQSNWKNKNSRANAISKVITNMKGKEQKALNNKENNQLDEMSTQAFLRRKQ